MKHISIHCLKIIVCFFLVHSATAQTEEILKQEFVNAMVISKIELPAHKSGINLYPSEAKILNVEEYRKTIKKYGFSIYTGDTIIIKNLKVKKKQIEVQVVNNHASRKPNNNVKVEEKKVGTYIVQVTEKEMQKLRRDEQMKISRNSNTKVPQHYNGSRFNIKFDRKLTPADLTIESVRKHLEDFIDFPD